MNRVFRKSKFRIDTGPEYVGWTADEYWNGWACPYFEFDEAMHLAETLPTGIGERARYDADWDEFTFLLSDCREAYHYPAQYIDTPNGKVKVYPIGAFEWTWEENDDSADSH